MDSLSYTDNKGYRRCLREIFHMNSANYSEKISSLNSLEQLDEETEDERPKFFPNFLKQNKHRKTNNPYLKR